MDSHQTYTLVGHPITGILCTFIRLTRPLVIRQLKMSGPSSSLHICRSPNNRDFVDSHQTYTPVGHPATENEWIFIKLAYLPVTRQLKSREPQVELLYLGVFKIENLVL